MQLRQLMASVLAMAVVAAVLCWRAALAFYPPELVDTIIVRYVVAGGEAHPVALVQGRLADRAVLGSNEVRLGRGQAVVLVRMCGCDYALGDKPRLCYLPYAPVCQSGMALSGLLATELLRPTFEEVDVDGEE